MTDSTPKPRRFSGPPLNVMIPPALADEVDVATLGNPSLPRADGSIRVTVKSPRAAVKRLRSAARRLDTAASRDGVTHAEANALRAARDVANERADRIEDHADRWTR